MRTSFRLLLPIIFGALLAACTSSQEPPPVLLPPAPPDCRSGEAGGRRIASEHSVTISVNSIGLSAGGHADHANRR